MNNFLCWKRMSNIMIMIFIVSKENIKMTLSIQWVCALFLSICNPMDCSPLGSSVHGIFQTRILEWVVISYSRGSSQSKYWGSVYFPWFCLTTAKIWSDGWTQCYSSVLFGKQRKIHPRGMRAGWPKKRKEKRDPSSIWAPPFICFSSPPWACLM